MTVTAKKLQDVHYDSLILCGLLQGLDIFISDDVTEPTPARNAAVALASEVVVKAQRLSDDIDRIEDAQRRLEVASVRGDVPTAGSPASTPPLTVDALVSALTAAGVGAPQARRVFDALTGEA